MKQQLVAANTRRLRAIESGEHKVVGVNAYTETEPSPLTAGQSILVVDESAERTQIERLRAFRARRSAGEVENALRELDDAIAAGRNVMPVSIRAAHAGVTTGEWTDTLRKRFGEYRAPTGVVAGESASASDDTAAVRQRVRALAHELGRPLKLLVGKPGLDGHSNGAEQIAVKARDVGIEVVYEGIRLTPEEIASSARDEGVHVIGLSILSGSHGVLVIDVLERLRAAGCGDLPVVVGGIIPEEDARALRKAGVARVYTPKDFDLTRIMDEIVDVVSESLAAA
jgi:(2R)-ethylmalonyl-CoA mutase